MNILRMKYILLICVLLIGIIQAEDTQNIQEVDLILSTHNLYPYGSFPEGDDVLFVANERFIGSAVDVVRCALQKMDIVFQIRVMPWKRAQWVVKNDKAHGFFAASQKDSRDDFAVMSEIIADQYWNWYLLRVNSWNPKDTLFRSQATVGGFLGANMLKWMKENKYNVMSTPIDTEGLLNVLLARHVDAVMANDQVMGALLKKHNAEDKVKMYVQKHKPLAVYFSKTFVKNNPGFMQGFNKNVVLCKE